MAWKGESQFCPDRKDWNGGGKFWPDLNGLNRQMLVFTCLEWLGMLKVDFGSTGKLEWLGIKEGVVDGRASRDAACHAGGSGFDSRSRPDLRLVWKRCSFL
jgi:hypothetical protein